MPKPETGVSLDCASRYITCHIRAIDGIAASSMIGQFCLASLTASPLPANQRDRWEPTPSQHETLTRFHCRHNSTLAGIMPATVRASLYRVGCLYHQALTTIDGNRFPTMTRRRRVACLPLRFSNLITIDGSIPRSHVRIARVRIALPSISTFHAIPDYMQDPCRAGAGGFAKCARVKIRSHARRSLISNPRASLLN